MMSFAEKISALAAVEHGSVTALDFFVDGKTPYRHVTLYLSPAHGRMEELLRLAERIKGYLTVSTVTLPAVASLSISRDLDPEEVGELKAGDSAREVSL